MSSPYCVFYYLVIFFDSFRPKDVVLTIQVATIDTPITNKEEIQTAGQGKTTKMVGTSMRCTASFATKKAIRKPIAPY